jgi:hypothetical protein
LNLSAIIDASVQKVWGILSALDFAWWGLVQSTTLVTGTSPRELDSTIKIQFKDGD